MTTKQNVKPNKTICIDHDITDIVEKITELGGKLSPVVCNLLRFYRDNDYRIPVKQVAAPAVLVDDAGMDDEDMQQPGESDADYRERMGF